MLSGDAKPQSASKGSASDTRGQAAITEENSILNGGYRKQILPDGKGGKLVRYIKGSFVLETDTAGKDFNLGSLDPDLPRDEVSSVKLLEFSWVRPQCKVGASVVEGVECDIFACPWEKETLAPNSTDTGTKRWVFAAIGRQDRLPRRLETPNEVKRYTFSILAAPPELPPEAFNAIERIKQSAKKMVQRYAIPQ